MNEDLIEKLDDLAFEFAMSSISYGGEDFSDIKRAKFAELLIKECAKFLEDNSGYDNSNHSWHPEPEELLAHFGLNND